jgi:hypothetical protein
LRWKKSGVQRVTSDSLSVLLCSMCCTKELVYSRSLLIPALCRIMWSRYVPLLHPSQYGFSPPIVLQRDEPRWCTPREFESSQIRDQWIQISVHKYCQLFPSSNTFLWNTIKIFCLLSIDCYYLFRLINHNHGIKGSMCVPHIFLAAVTNTYHLPLTPISK